MFKWSSSYSLGIEEIDTQHMRLFELAGNLLKMSKHMESHYDPEELMDIIEELCAYTIYHFETEKKYFEKYEYPSESHEKEHLKFENFLAKLNIDDIESHTSDSLFNVLKFIDDWIKHHILIEDLKLVDYIKKSQVS